MAQLEAIDRFQKELPEMMSKAGANAARWVAGYAHGPELMGLPGMRN